jgi:hypothetical protein
VRLPARSLTRPVYSSGPAEAPVGGANFVWAASAVMAAAGRRAGGLLESKSPALGGAGRHYPGALTV